jgi:hypothetical protein
MSEVLSRDRDHVIGGGAPVALVTAADIRAQLDRILASPFFRSSKRCRLLLAHVVEHSLTDSPEPLKERTLGVAVFARDATYDTAADPVVRVAAGEIRRRLGQYYADAAHHRELRIDLPAGSYGPTYEWPAPEPQTVPPLQPAAPAPSHAPRRRWWGAAVPLLGLAVVLVAVEIIRARAGGTVFDEFWAPFLHARMPVLVCAGGLDMYELPWELKAAANAAADSAPGAPLVVSPREVQRIGVRYLAVSDAVATARLAAIFQQRRRPHYIRENSATSFADLRESPVVLVGMFSNEWSLQLGAHFRFLPVIEGDGHHVGIQDRQRPDQPWRIPRPWPSLKVTRDYALVSRVVDRTTGTLVVSAGGITPFGTTAAVEFVTEPRHLDQALAHVSGWSRRNLQIVLETEIFDGASGVPRVVAMHVW